VLITLVCGSTDGRLSELLPACDGELRGTEAVSGAEGRDFSCTATDDGGAGSSALGGPVAKENGDTTLCTLEYASLSMWDGNGIEKEN